MRTQPHSAVSRRPGQGLLTLHGFFSPPTPGCTLCFSWEHTPVSEVRICSLMSGKAVGLGPEASLRRGLWAPRLWARRSPRPQQHCFHPGRGASKQCIFREDESFSAPELRLGFN